MPTHYRGDECEVLALDTFIKLTRATDSLVARLSRSSSVGGLTPSQFGVLEALHHLGPLNQSEISAKLLKSEGNITLVIDNLEKQNLVRRQRSEVDRRVVQVFLTDAGEALIADLFPAHAAAIVRELAALTADEQRALGHLCRKLGRREA